MAVKSLHLINTGFFHADGGAMFGATPQSAWKRRYACDEQNRCVLAMHVGLVITGNGRIVLIDTGVGDKQLEQLGSTTYQFFDLVNLSEAIGRYGVMPEQVTDIVLTHLHFDHCGYVTKNEYGRIIPSFPNATCWVSQSQWENAVRPNPLEIDSYFPENIAIIEQTGKLRLIHEDYELCENEIILRIYDGHTVGQIVPFVQTEQFRVVFAGDVIPIAAQISPKWISGFDIYPLTSYYEKMRLLNEAAESNDVIVYYHDAYTPCATIKKINNFFKIDRKIGL